MDKIDMSKYDYESEMSADHDALAFARQALEDSDEFIRVNDLGDRSASPVWDELGAVLLAYAAMGAFVAICFWMAGFSPEAKAAKFHADDPKVFLDINVASKHSQDYWYLETEYHGIGGSYTEITEEEFNEDNAGLGIRWEVDEVLDVSVGFYDNSFYNTSVYAGLELHTPRKYWVSVGVALAAVSGYSGTPTDTPLVFLPVVQLGPPQMGARIGHLPFGEVKFTTFQLYVGF